MKPEHEGLAARAREVLEDNWMGHATKPAPRLYPHQWSWDAGFIAIGFAHFDQSRAEQELRSLFAGQWDNGMVPHIVFSSEGDGYFPGPDFWQCAPLHGAPEGVETSGITQPPNHATAVRHVLDHAAEPEQALEFVAEMYPKLVRSHEYLYRERDPEEEGLVYVRHNWESGQDNSPIWDQVLARINPPPEEIPPYQRRDLHVVDASDRPLDIAYDRYIWLVDLFRRHGYKEEPIRRRNPFLVQDVLFNTLLVAANRDLAFLAQTIDEDPSRYLEWAELTAAAMNDKLWDAEACIYLDYDLAADELIPAHVGAGFSPLYAEIPDREQAELIVKRLNTDGFCPINADCWPVPSFDREHPSFDSKRYWRGPIWVNLNWLLYHGLRRYGYTRYADKIRAAMIELPLRSGFYEYFDPETMRGHGSPDFSWTAALVLDLLVEEELIA